MISDADTIANGSYTCINGSEDNRNHSDVWTHGGTISSEYLTDWDQSFFKDFSLLPHPPIIITITVTKNNG